mgnify:FL=1
MRVTADLHNHSCLSPCGDLSMSPSALAERARERGINLLALTDHNSARNAPAFAAACRRCGIMPLFGTETTSTEEVHVVSLFPDVSAALDWGAWVYERLPDYRHDPERFGDQVVVDAEENILDFEKRYLIPAIDASLQDIGAETLARGGLVIPAHIDRSVNSLLSQLGFLPDMRVSALEITRWPPVIDGRGASFTCSSDAHFLDDVGKRSFAFDADLGADSEPRAVFAALSTALQEGRTTLSIAN